MAHNPNVNLDADVFVSNEVPSADKDAVEAGWKIHAALVDWTGKVDTKASFTLTIEAAILAGVITLSSADRVFAKLSGWFPVALYVLGIALLVAAVMCAVLVVRPRLRSPNLKAESEYSYIYFGHLRFLDEETVSKHLRETPLLPVLAKQLVEMSKIAWEKHRYVQVSMTLAVIGVALLGLCAGASTGS